MNDLPTLILLHGARGSCQSMLPLAQEMSKACVPVLPNLLGHGGRPIPDEFSVQKMALDVLQQLDSRNIESAYFFGYSFGGYLALYLARHAPERVRGVCTLATKVLYDEKAVALFMHLSRPDRVQNRQRAVMDQRHPGQDWSKLVSGLANLYRAMGQTPVLTDSDFQRITVPTLTISASNDQIVPWTEALKLAYLLPQGQGFTFAGKAHPFNVIPIPFLATIIVKWLECVDSRRAES